MPRPSSAASLAPTTLLAVLLSLLLAFSFAAPASADPDHVPGGPCIQDDQNVSRSAVHSYADVERELAQIARTSRGAVSISSAGTSGEGRELYYATVGEGPTTFWLQARIHGNELQSTEAVLNILRRLGGSSQEAQRLREQLTIIVIPMYNPDGAEANTRGSTTPNRIDLNRDWEDFRQVESVAFWNLWRETAPQFALDLHHFGGALVEGTNDRNQFQIGARSIDPSRMTDLQWATNQAMAMVSVDALEQYGVVNVAKYRDIDITNAALSRMLMGGTAPDGAEPVLDSPTQGAIFYEVHSTGQKSKGQQVNMFEIPTMAVLHAVASGELLSYDVSGYDDLPYARGRACR